MRDPAVNLWEAQHHADWLARYNREVWLASAFEKLGHTRDDSRKLAAEHIAGVWRRPGDNGGPALET